MHERLKEAVTYIKFSESIKSQKDLSVIIEYDKTNLSSALNGNERYLNDQLIERIVHKFPFINKYWLLTGEGEMLSKPVPTKTTTKETPPIYEVGFKDLSLDEKMNQMHELLLMSSKKMESILKTILLQQEEIAATNKKIK